jgi:hypothetical protein
MSDMASFFNEVSRRSGHRELIFGINLEAEFGTSHEPFLYRRRVHFRFGEHSREVFCTATVAALENLQELLLRKLHGECMLCRPVDCH